MNTDIKSLAISLVLARLLLGSADGSDCRARSLPRSSKVAMGATLSRVAMSLAPIPACPFC